MFPRTPTALLPPPSALFHSPQTLVQLEQQTSRTTPGQRLPNITAQTAGYSTDICAQAVCPASSGMNETCLGFKLVYLLLFVWLLLVNTPSSRSLMHMYLFSAAPH